MNQIYSVLINLEFEGSMTSRILISLLSSFEERGVRDNERVGCFPLFIC